MNLQTLLGDLPISTFVAEYLHRQPFSSAGGAKPFCGLGSWKTLGEILAQPGADVMVVRQGRQIAGRDPHNEQEARALAAEGCTVLVRHVERLHPALAEWGQAFAADFSAEVDIHIYATPPGEHGFSWHYDAEDVFILQTAGVKEYSLRKNTVHPWPLVETIPSDMRYPAEIMPLVRVLLRAGDWLYIPCGWWHKAEAPPADETAISVAVGVMPPTAMAILDLLRPRLVQSLVWRQRLPGAGAASAMPEAEMRAVYRQLLAQLSNDLTQTLADEGFLGEVMERIAG